MLNSNLTNSVYNFNNNDSETEKKASKLLAEEAKHIGRCLCFHTSLVREGTQGMLTREHVSSQATLTREYKSTQGALTREARKHPRHTKHESTQSTLARVHIRTQDTLARAHVFSSQTLAKDSSKTEIEPFP